MRRRGPSSPSCHGRVGDLHHVESRPATESSDAPSSCGCSTKFDPGTNFRESVSAIHEATGVCEITSGRNDASPQSNANSCAIRLIAGLEPFKDITIVSAVMLSARISKDMRSAAQFSFQPLNATNRLRHSDVCCDLRSPTWIPKICSSSTVRGDAYQEYAPSPSPTILTFFPVLSHLWRTRAAKEKRSKPQQCRTDLFEPNASRWSMAQDVWIFILSQGSPQFN